METETILEALAEAVDALGDIPAENCTEQQRNAYRLCVEARNKPNHRRAKHQKGDEKMKETYIITLLVGLAVFSGCATIITGKHQNIPVTSEPSGIKVRANTGEVITTPGQFTFVRNKQHILVAECSDGKSEQQVLLKNGIQGWFFANILLGGIPGMIVDLITGACDELKPKTVHFVCN